MENAVFKVLEVKIMKEEAKKSFTMRRSGWSSFSIIGFIIFGILMPALLLTHVFSDYATYIAGYATHAEKTIEQSIDEHENELADFEAKISSANQTISANQAKISQINAEISALDEEIKTAKTKSAPAIMALIFFFISFLSFNCFQAKSRLSLICCIFGILCVAIFDRLLYIFNFLLNFLE
jgi:hypothetical protein